MHLTEKSSALSNVYDAVKGTKVTEFRFFDDALIDQSGYAITLDVGDKCKRDIPLVEENIDGLSGNLQWRSIARNQLNDRIDQEEFEVEPGIILISGDEIQN